jgi:TRAP transporter TAXI family solute receptor
MAQLVRARRGLPHFRNGSIMPTWRSAEACPVLKDVFVPLALASWIVAASFVADVRGQDSEAFVIIGTGGVTAVYYPTGGAICRVVNQASANIRCLVQSTGGSIDNIERIRNGELQFGFAQSDWQYHAFHGTDRFAELGAFEDLRAVFSLHAEPFTIVARADAHITHLDDLKGKRVNIGNPGSGQRATMDVVMAAKGWSLADFAEVRELTSVEQSEALCADQVDAIVMTVGHPSASIQKATTGCDGVLVEVGGAEIDRLVEQHPYYRHATIPAGLYNNEADVPTFGVAATVVSSTQVPEDVVHNVVAAVIDHFEEFKELHPALNHLKADEMPREGISIPLHAGAERYYREAGLLGVEQ